MKSTQKFGEQIFLKVIVTKVNKRKKIQIKCCDKNEIKIKNG